MLRRQMFILFPTLGMIAFGQGPHGYGKGMKMPNYNSATEGTFNGTIESVTEIDHYGCYGKGLHANLKTESGVFELHIGPASFAEKEGLTLAKGDQVEVVGSKATQTIIVRTIKKGDKTFTLRNAQGKPLWGGCPQSNK
jgi:hypothetical protein